MEKYSIGFRELILYANDLAKDVGMSVQSVQDLRELTRIVCSENVSADQLEHAHAFRLGEWLGIVQQTIVDAIVDKFARAKSFEEADHGTD